MLPLTCPHKRRVLGELGMLLVSKSMLVRAVLHETSMAISLNKDLLHQMFLSDSFLNRNSQMTYKNISSFLQMTHSFTNFHSLTHSLFY